ncbi:MAG: hypothetical protein AAF623_12985 [Planctomycetota bacterium]
MADDLVFVLRTALVMFATLGIAGCSTFQSDGTKNSDGIEKVISEIAVSQTSVQSDSQNSGSLSKSKEQKVEFDGGLLLGKTDEVAYQPADLAKILADWMDSGKWTSTSVLVRLYPDICRRILMQENAPLSASHLNQLAKLYDNQWSKEGTNQWMQLVKSIQTDPTTIEFFEKRSEFLQLIGSNQPEKALELRLTRGLGKASNLLVAEAFRLEGIAYLMLESEAKCIARFDQSVEQLVENHPIMASHVLLLLGEAQRHSQLTEDWKATWIRAVNLQSQLVATKRLKDPVFWKKAAFLRPVQTDWPNLAVAKIKDSLRFHNLEFGSDPNVDVESIIWAQIGIQSLQRHEAHNAILSLKKAEALVAGNQLQTELQLQQAMAMIDGGQPGPASAILLRLGSTASMSGDRAKALLATQKLQQGSLAQGMNLLQSAIASSAQWPDVERLRCQADYALSFLMRGKESQGIKLLNQVQKEFLGLQEFEQSILCLSNMATYYQMVDKTSEYRQTLKRIQMLESGTP